MVELSFRALAACGALGLVALLPACTSMDGRVRISETYASRRAEGLRVAALPFAVSARDEDPVSRTLAPLGSLLALEGLGDGAPEAQAAGAVMQRALLALLGGSPVAIEEQWVTRTELAHAGLDRAAMEDRSRTTEIARRLGVDALLYGEVYEWDRSYYGVQSTQSVGLRVWLIDGESGEELAFAERWRQEGAGLTGGPTGYVSAATSPIQGLAASTLAQLAIQVAYDIAEDLLGGASSQPFDFENARGEVPRLSFVSADPPHLDALQAGASVRVIAVGTSGAQASFDLGAYRTRIPMLEIETRDDSRGRRSTYIGSYVLQPGETLASLPIRVHLERPQPDGRLLRGATKLLATSR
ncbi:MAG: hypothetical protein IPN34_19960 [Planctomycetes bacterium]|nr:hypothetical protein [Planctomycetota bacterium]